MKIILDHKSNFKDLEKNITSLAADGFKTIMVFHAEGGLDKIPEFKTHCDALLKKTSQRRIQIFGGIFPGIMSDGKLMDRGSILAGIRSRVHIVTLDRLGEPDLAGAIAKKLPPFDPDHPENNFKTLFVIGDGFGESNHTLIRGLNRFVETYPLKVIGGLAGRNTLKASHFNIFTPGKVIQNGAVLAFTDLESGIGVNHGWLPLEKSDCTITRTNYCYVETINKKPALEFYLDFISRIDPKIAGRKQALLSGDADLFFKEVAIKYPLGLIRKQKDGKQIIDRTAVSVGADRSLQFSAEIPEGTRACILHLSGKSAQAQCLNIREAAQTAYVESLNLFPTEIPAPRVFIMDCFGRKQMVDNLGYNYEAVEFDLIAADQKEKDHSPLGVLTFGEISTMPPGYVELHNKTAVVATIEDN
ncbi:MAG: FIST C-terminal domain-containing protein [Desulfobacterales bacterium]|nr:FIST C-terminal domain-containing protein [Desulfobacterales bacterium]